MFEGDLALMIPIVAVVTWSPIGKAIAASIHAVADQMQAKADLYRNHGALNSGSSAQGDPLLRDDAALADRIKLLEEEIHHLREAAVMAPWSSKTIGQSAAEPTMGSESEGLSPPRKVAQ